MTIERITYDGDRNHLDEIVLTGATVHLEAMNTHDWTLIIDAAGGGHITLNARDVHVYETDGVEHLTRFDPPLLGCPVEWETKGWRTHRCRRAATGHRKHRCECGKRAGR